MGYRILLTTGNVISAPQRATPTEPTETVPARVEKQADGDALRTPAGSALLEDSDTHTARSDGQGSGATTRVGLATIAIACGEVATAHFTFLEMAPGTERTRILRATGKPRGLAVFYALFGVFWPQRMCAAWLG